MCFRDYGRLDMAHLRFPGDSYLAPCLYRRGEGTLSYFFTTGKVWLVGCVAMVPQLNTPHSIRIGVGNVVPPDRVRALFQAAGFACESCEYHTVRNVNRKTGVTLGRVFVHGTFVLAKVSAGDEVAASSSV